LTAVAHTEKQMGPGRPGHTYHWQMRVPPYWLERPFATGLLWSIMPHSPSPDFDREAMARARNEKGWSQSRLADEAGVSLSTVKKWELGLRKPDESVAGRLAFALGVQPGSLGLAIPDLDSATLATIRRSRRITAPEMAAAVGVSERTLTRVESGELLPPDSAAYAKAYGITLAQLAAAWKRSGR
jgi:transcriptional regulator with XRE-family HTH domain